jgi:hypothetical protein
VGPHGLPHPLPLPARRGGVIGVRVDWLVRLPMTAAGFDQVQVRQVLVDHLSSKVHAVPTRATATAADAAQIILEMALRSGDGVPDVLVVDHDPKFTSTLFRESHRVQPAHRAQHRVQPSHRAPHRVQPAHRVRIPQGHQRPSGTGQQCAERHTTGLRQRPE